MNKKLILSLTCTSFLLLGCGDQTKEEVKEVSNKTIDKVAEVTEDTTQKATKIVKEIEKETKPIIDNVLDKSKEALQSSKSIIDNVTKSAVEVKEDIQKQIHTATAPKKDGKALYSRCISCHGAKAEKKALNVSAVIKGWSEEKVLESLKGYKEGTYGGAMKSIMSGQVSSLNESELKALANYISTL